jgi:seryl-tRNA synthetase
MEQSQAYTHSNPQVGGSNPTSSTRVYKFLESLANDTKPESTDIELKIAQLKRKLKTKLESNKKIKQRMKEQAKKLKLGEQELDNIYFDISQLEAQREQEDEDMR